MMHSSVLAVLLLLQQAEDKTKWKIAGDGGGTFFHPPQASTVAKYLDSDYWMIQNWSIFFTVLIFGVLFYFIVKYNRKSHPKAVRTSTHNTALELLWSVPPGFVLIYMFWRGFVGYEDLRTAPLDSYKISVTAQKWSWTFTYPNGVVSNELHLPVDRPSTLTMTSTDVIHSLFVPAFRTKMDVVPGRYTQTWFQPIKTGQFLVLCTEYCGTQHSDMLAKVFVHTEADFQKWLDEEANWLKNWKGTPAEAGQKVFNQFCTQCHRVDGTKLIGPALNAKFGASEQLADGTSVTVDDAYLRESIYEPNKKIVAGFTPQMPSFKGVIQDPYVDVLVEYIKSLKDTK